jgi:hypothetical protein
VFGVPAEHNASEARFAPRVAEPGNAVEPPTKALFLLPGVRSTSGPSTRHLERTPLRSCVRRRRSRPWPGKPLPDRVFKGPRPQAGPNVRTEPTARAARDRQNRGCGRYLWALTLHTYTTGLCTLLVKVEATSRGADL